MSSKIGVAAKSGFANFLFYSNYFYGICAVALSIEATLQQGFPLSGGAYYLIVFMTTVLYYSYPYIRKSLPGANPRTNWYTRYYSFMWLNQVIITVMLLLVCIFFLSKYGNRIWPMSAWQWLLALIFPAVCGLYYGINSASTKFNIRKIGWLKPFIIGFAWAGMVTVYPILFFCIVNDQPFHPNLIGFLLFLKNFMFITVLCIIFDIKDYTLDYINQLKTFVVQFGLRKTIFLIAVPLTLIGLSGFIYYAVAHQFEIGKLILNTIPFLLLIVAAFSLQKTRSLTYYLVVIDGLMLVKAICGTIAITYF